MWDIIDFEEKYFQEMLEMTVEYYGKDNDISNEEFVYHEYFRNPYGKALIKLAYDYEKRRLAGQYIVIPRNVMVDGIYCKSVLSLNTLTRADYRGQQVFTHLAEAVYQEGANQRIGFCYGMPNQNSYPGFVRKLNFFTIGDIPLYLKILNPGRLLLDKLNWFKKEDKRLKINKDNLQLRDINIVRITRDNVSLFDKFWKKIYQKYRVMGIRDSEYIRWRYLDMPLRKYEILMAIKEDIPQGYIIGRISEVSRMRCGMIVDFLVGSQRSEVGKELLNYLIQIFRRSHVGLVGSLMQKNCEEKFYLRKSGFFQCPKELLPQPFPVICRLLDPGSVPDEKRVKDFSQWFFTMGDYDVI